MSFELHREPLDEAARRASDLFVEIYTGLERRRVDPGADPASLRRRFEDTLLEEGVGLLRVLEEFRTWVLPASMGTPHPLYLGLVNSSPFPAAALADLLVSSLNNNGGAFHQSPAMSACEGEVVRTFARLFGFEAPVSGMLLPGGTFATLQGLTLARARHFPDWQESGPVAVERPPVMYTSQAGHFSVQRSATALGLGRRGVVAVDGTGRGEMDVCALEEHVERDLRDGRRPFAVVATVGTTGTGAIDPLRAIAELCRRYDLWLHVDACYGGAAVLLEEMRGRFEGIAQADSIAVDPHKWFFVPVTAAVLLTRDESFERETFLAGDTSYIPQHAGVDPFLRGLPTSRRSSGLTVWMALRAHGISAVRDAVRSNIALIRLLEALLADAGFRVLDGGELSVACARWEAPGASPVAIDQLQREIAADMVDTGDVWFSTTRHAGQTWLRFNLVNLYTRERHIRKLAAQLVDVARRRSACRGGSM
jgi:aromatic-L-amino-acid decarboxylase